MRAELLRSGTALVGTGYRLISLESYLVHRVRSRAEAVLMSTQTKNTGDTR